MFKPMALVVPLLTLFLAACGGSGDPVVSGGDGNNGDGDGSAGTSSLTYTPLQFYQQGEGYVDGEFFQGVGFDNLIKGYIISPVNSSNLEPANNPSLSEYSVTINDQAIDRVESGLMMQPIIGLPVQLNTAILIDTSSSNSSVSRQRITDEIKQYISQVKQSSDPVIRNQQFTLGTFSRDITAVEGSFTSDQGTLFSALDGIGADNTSENGTKLYQAIVEAVGGFKGAVSGSEEKDYTDAGGQHQFDNLIDGYVVDNGSNGAALRSLTLSSVIVFTDGSSSGEIFTAENAVTALSWQSILAYDESNPAPGNTNDDDADDGDEVESNGATAPDGMRLLRKPLLYVSLGNTLNNDLRGAAKTVIEVTNDNALEGVAEKLIAAQKSALKDRVQPNNRYLVRFALLPREGEHSIVFSSNASNYNYSLTSDLKFVAGQPVPPKEDPRVEIAGPKNAFLAGYGIQAGVVERLYPATRWATETYNTADYSWTVDGMPRTPAADGSIAISAADAGKTVVLENVSLSSGVRTASMDILP